MRDNNVDLELLSAYRNSTDENIRTKSLNELLVRHEGYFKSVAKFAVRDHHNIGEYDDFYQSAKIGAIEAYKKFDMSKPVRLSSYVVNNIKYYLLDMCNSEGYIKYPSHVRKIKSYLTGKYDLLPEKKAAFEKEYGINTYEDRVSFALHYSGLCENFHNDYTAFDQNNETSFDLPDKTFSEDSLLSHINLEMIQKSLSTEEFELFRLYFFEDLSGSEVGDCLHISKQKVHQLIRQLREKINENFA